MAEAQRLLVFRKGVTPTGDRDGVNLEFEVPESFNKNTLEVFLSGLYMEPVVDWEYTTGNKFKINLAINNPDRLNRPPLQHESFYINYIVC